MMLFVAALALVSCVDDVVETPSTEAKAGDEVQFGLTLPISRTVYGEEANNAFPIYWEDGDKVTIFSPDCLETRRSAEYKVILPDNGDKAYYAKDLQKTGAYGVQWGNNDTADFYSLYPSGSYTLSKDGKNAEGVKINYIQNIVVNADGSVTSDMEDCLMYARTTDVTKGNVVNLEYNPISTVLYLTLKVAANETGTDADTFTIQSVSLTADKEIAGTFNLDIANGKFAGFASGASKMAMAQVTNPASGGFHSISNGQSISLPLFLAPQENLNVKSWTIHVVANGNTYTKTLGIDKVLTPGKIHKITLPELKPATTEWQVSRWMTYIPRNVYLSEISIPGSWNSLNKEFQPNTTEDGTTITGTSISNQYDRGIRAFHLDTRWQGTGSSYNIKCNNILGIADGGDTKEAVSDGRVMTDVANNPSVEDALDEIIDNLKADEYMVLMCTFAQGSYNHSYTTDGVAYDWVGEISRICSTKTEVYDAKNLTPNTLVGDVLGKVIVIVNMEGVFTTVPSDSKCLFVNAPLKLTNDLFPTTLNDDKNKTNLMTGTAGANTPSDTKIDIYNTQAQVCIAGETYTDSRSRDNVDGRGFAPTFGERKTVANNILNWSKNNYGTTNYAHDKWIYLGLGGYYMYYKDDGFLGIGNGWKAESDGHKNVASDCNTWINGKVTEMGTTPEGQTAVVPYYPVGIVLMNYANTYKDTAVKNILMLNNKYRLQYDSSKPVDYNPNAKAKSAYDGTLNTGGNAY